MALIFDNRNPLLYLLVLALALLLRWPSLACYTPEAESLAWAAGQRLLQGRGLYSDANLNQAPLPALVFAALEGVLGGAPLSHFRWLHGLGVVAWVLASVLFSQLLYRLRFTEGYRLGPAVLFLLLGSATPYQLGQLGAQGLVLLQLGMLYYLLRYYIEESASWKHLYRAGLLAGLASLWHYSGLWLGVWALGALPLLGRWEKRPTSLVLGGWLLPLLGALVVGLLFNQLSGYWSWGVKGAWQDWWRPAAGGSQSLWLHPLLLWAPVLALGAWGWLAYRSQWIPTVRRQRRFEVLMQWTALVGLLAILAAGRGHAHTAFLLLAPAGFYAFSGVGALPGRRLRLAGKVLLATPAVGVLLWWALAFGALRPSPSSPTTGANSSPAVYTSATHYLLQQLRLEGAQRAAYRRHSRLGPPTAFLTSPYASDWPRLHLQPATPWIHWPLAQQRLTPLLGGKARSHARALQPETVLAQWRQEQPQLWYDRQGLYPRFAQHLLALPKTPPACHRRKQGQPRPHPANNPTAAKLAVYCLPEALLDIRGVSPYQQQPFPLQFD